MIPLYLSTWPFPEGLYGVVLLVAIPSEVKKDFNSCDIKEDPLSE